MSEELFWLLLFGAASDKISSLRTDDLLVDRLFEAVETSLRHAQLDLIFSLLPLQCLRCGLAGKPLAARNGRRGGGIGWNGGSGCGRLGICRDRQSEHACRNDAAQQKPHDQPSG
jgi:hypothetical protein